MIAAEISPFKVPAADMAIHSGIGDIIGWRYVKTYPEVGRWEPTGFQFIGTDGILETDLDGTPYRVSSLYVMPEFVA